MSVGRYLRSCRGPTLWALSFPSLSHLRSVSVCTLSMRAASLIEMSFGCIEVLLDIVYKLYYK